MRRSPTTWSWARIGEPPVARGPRFDPRRGPPDRRGSWSAGSASRPARCRTRRTRCRAATRSALVIARELAGERPAIIAAQPTRGIDIAASRFVHDELRGAPRGGRRHPAHLRRPDRDPGPGRPDRGPVRRAAHGRGRRRPARTRSGWACGWPASRPVGARRSDRRPGHLGGGAGCPASLTRRGLARYARAAGVAPGHARSWCPWSRSAWGWPSAPSPSCSPAATSIEAYGELLRGAVGTPSNLNATLARAVPIVVVGVGLAIAFRAGALNLGGEGQMIMAARGHGRRRQPAGRRGRCPSPSSSAAAMGCAGGRALGARPDVAPGALRGAAAHHDPAAQLRRGAVRRVSRVLPVAGGRRRRRPDRHDPRAAQLPYLAPGGRLHRACCCWSCCHSPRGGSSAGRSWAMRCA